MVEMDEQIEMYLRVIDKKIGDNPTGSWPYPTVGSGI
jgi:hypothetical protein